MRKEQQKQKEKYNRTGGMQENEPKGKINESKNHKRKTKTQLRSLNF